MGFNISRFQRWSVGNLVDNRTRGVLGRKELFKRGLREVKTGKPSKATSMDSINWANSVLMSPSEGSLVVDVGLTVMARASQPPLRG
jgi:hypothetical protein